MYVTGLSKYVKEYDLRKLFEPVSTYSAQVLGLHRYFSYFSMEPSRESELCSTIRKSARVTRSSISRKM